MPQKVIDRAKEILVVLQKHSPATETITIENIDNIENIESFAENIDSKTDVLKNIKTQSIQPSLFSEEEFIIEEILSMNIDELTPLEALKNLARWQKQLYNK